MSMTMRSSKPVAAIMILALIGGGTPVNAQPLDPAQELIGLLCGTIGGFLADLINDDISNTFDSLVCANPSAFPTICEILELIPDFKDDFCGAISDCQDDFFCSLALGVGLDLISDIDLDAICSANCDAPSGPSSPSGPAGTCNPGDCGGPSSTGGCFCDPPSCQSYGDCCPNFSICLGGGPSPNPVPSPNPAAACVPSDCGGASSSGQCFCDPPFCLNYGDCCPNAEIVCSTNPVASPPPPPPVFIPTSSPPPPPQTIPVSVFLRWGTVSGTFIAPLEFRATTVVSGFQFAYSGPQPLSASLAMAGMNAGLTPSIGTQAILLFSLSGGTLPPSASFVSLLDFGFSPAVEGQTFCILPQATSSTAVSGPGGAGLGVTFDGSNCVVLEVSCAFVGTGDVTQDGILNISDIIVIVESISSGIPLADECAQLAGDSNNDGLVNIQDVVGFVEIITQTPP